MKNIMLLLIAGLFSTTVSFAQYRTPAPSCQGGPVYDEGYDDHDYRHRNRQYKNEYEEFRYVCDVPMGYREFADAEAAIAGQAFPSGKVRVAKQILSNNCVSTRQVIRLMDRFSFEKDRLAIAKFAYRSVTNPEAYFKVNRVFSFSSSVDELNRYISRQAPRRSPRSRYEPPYGYEPGGYYHGISDREFFAIQDAINEQSMDRNKLMIARQALRGKYLTSRQVLDLMGSFSFERNRLEFAKFAYAQTLDPENYYLVNQGFTFNSSIRDLDQFLATR